jgi:flavin reductase (DIM6/NTAB) family NADH-FMN oxidoreductase RutF
MAADGIRDTLAALWSPLLAITTAHQGGSNGLIAATGVFASILPEAPRVFVELAKANLTHDLVLASGVFALHLLPATPAQALETSLSMVRVLGMRSGRDGDKLGMFPSRSGVTGSPILTDALTYVEARVVATLDGGELTGFLGDVVGGERLHDGEVLTARILREHMPAEWQAEWQASLGRQLAEARRLRGLPG